MQNFQLTSTSHRPKYPRSAAAGSSTLKLYFPISHTIAELVWPSIRYQPTTHSTARAKASVQVDESSMSYSLTEQHTTNSTIVNGLARLAAATQSSSSCYSSRGYSQLCEDDYRQAGRYTVSKTTHSAATAAVAAFMAEYKQTRDKRIWRGSAYEWCFTFIQFDLCRALKQFVICRRSITLLFIFFKYLFVLLYPTFSASVLDLSRPPYTAVGD